MKGTAALLVVMGAILILAPAFLDYLYQLNLAHLAARATSAPGVTGQLGNGYRLFLIIFGAFMVFVGIGMGFSALERGPKA
jgi:hypothetical protein